MSGVSSGRYRHAEWLARIKRLSFAGSSPGLSDLRIATLLFARFCPDLS